MSDYVMLVSSLMYVYIFCYFHKEIDEFIFISNIYLCFFSVLLIDFELNDDLGKHFTVYESDDIVIIINEWTGDVVASFNYKNFQLDNLHQDVHEIHS